LVVATHLSPVVALLLVELYVECQSVTRFGN
jgi:hypothetical protein